MATKSKKPTIEYVEEEAIVDAEEYITFKRSHFYSVLVVLAFAVGLLSGFVIWGRDTEAVTTVTVPSAALPAEAPVAAPTAIPEPVIYDIETEGFPAWGPEDAPITIVEFSDYQCPYCYRWHTQVYDQLIAAYPDQIRFVYRNYPLSFHQNAFPAAEAALCAGDQDKYWELHGALFDNQALLNNQAGIVLDQAQYNGIAEPLGIDLVLFEECMTSHKYQQAILDDMQYASNLPFDANGEAAVGGTPSFFINGNRLGGAYPFEYFKEIIDAELAKN